MKKLLLLSVVCVLGLFGSLRAQEAEIIPIGSGDGSINYAPTYVYNKYAMTQQIFTAEEMQNKSGKITSVTFQCVGTRNANRTFKVYMVNTNKTSFNSSTDWVAVTDGDLVYEGAVSFVGGSATTITFATPFTYKKGQNVVLCVNDITAMDQTKVTSFASETKSENRLLYVNNYYDIYDATNMSSVSGTVAATVNQVQFTLVDDGSGEVLDPAPNAPANLKAEALNDTEIQLTWDAVEGALYNVYQGEDAIVKGLTETTYTVGNLTPRTNYCFTVTAAKDLESDKSEEACAETESRATTFAFDFNDGIVDMHVFQGANASTTNGWKSAKDFPLADMVESIKNYYKGVDGTMAVYSMTYDMVENNYVPYIPDNYIVTNKPYMITETSTLEWDIRQVEENKTDHYSIVVSESGTNFVDVWFERYSDNTGATKAYSLADYAGKEIYIGFHHYKQTDGGALSLDNVKLVLDSQITPEKPVDMDAPTIPDNVKAIAWTASSIKVKWNASDNATSYNIYKGDEVVTTSVAGTEYMVEGLEASTQYCFTVTAVNGDKESAKSSEACAKTFDAEIVTLAAPTNLTADALPETKIQLSWDAVDGAKTYKVYQENVYLLTVAETTCQITNELQAGREYCFTVTAVNGATESKKSDETCVTTLVEEGVAKPATPQNFKVQALVPGELTLSWDAVDGAKEYNIYEDEYLLGTVTVTKIDMTDFDPETEYCFTVTALNEGGESDKSEEACATTLGESIEENTVSFNIYPNPVNDVLFIETEVEINEVSIFDVYGRQQVNMTTGQQVDVKNLNSGVYFVKIVAENGEVVKRFVKK